MLWTPSTKTLGIYFNQDCFRIFSFPEDTLSIDPSCEFFDSEETMENRAKPWWTIGHHTQQVTQITNSNLKDSRNQYPQIGVQMVDGTSLLFAKPNLLGYYMVLYCPKVQSGRCLFFEP